ncbi:7050_t:CDS:2, partial [Ambispora gerdemannii]
SDLEKLTEKEAKINDLLTQIKTLQEKVKEEKISPLSKTQEELNDKEEKFNKLESEIKELRKKEDELEDEISDLKKQIRKANNDQEKKTLEEKLEDVNKELERTQDKLKVSEETRGKLRNEMNTLRDKLKELQSAKGNELDRLSYENNQLTLDLNVAKEKIRKLENSERSSEQIKELQEKNNSLTKQLEETRSELSFLKITNSLNESKDKEVGEMASELSDSNKKLEEGKEEKTKLEKEVGDKEKQKQTLENEGKINSEEYKKLLSELEELRKKLASIDQEIEKSRRQNENLKEQLNASYQSLQEEIEEKKEQLREAKNNCLKKMERNQSWRDFVKNSLGDTNDADKVETLLKAQKEITRDSNDKFATDEKKRIIESTPKELTGELNALCVLQDYLTQLEIKKENFEKAGQALKTVLIAPVIPPHLRNKESDIEDRNDIENNVNYNKIFSESREFILQKNHKTEKLPTRLYNIQENRVVETKNNTDIRDNKDKNQEVPKMRQYYFNSAVTLISINRSLGDEEITEKGVESEKPAYTDTAHYKSILDEGSQKIATPLGWVNYKDGYNEEDRISFTLNQALRAIKNRGRGVSIDGIYSILGLLPYGDKKDLEKALFDIMLAAIKEGGREDDSGYPRKTKGGTSIEGGINIIHKQFEEVDSNSDIKITVSKCVIEEIHGGSNRKEEKNKGTVIDSGACTGNVLIAPASDDDQKAMEIRLLVRKNEDKDIYQRIGLAETSKEDWEKLQEVGKKEKLIIKIDEEQVQIQLRILAAQTKVENELKTHESNCSHKNNSEARKKVKQDGWEQVKKSTTPRADLAYHEEYECGQEVTKKIAIYFSPNQGGHEHADLTYAGKIKKEELTLEKDNQGEIYQEKTGD